MIVAEMRGPFLFAAVMAVVFVLSTEVAGASGLRTAELKTEKLAAGHCREIPNCARSGVRSCEKLSELRFSCRGFVYLVYGPAGEGDNLNSHANVVWKRESPGARLELARKPRWSLAG